MFKNTLVTIILYLICNNFVFAQLDYYPDWVDTTFDYSCTSCNTQQLSKTLTAAPHIENVIIAVDYCSYAESVLPSWFSDGMAGLHDFFDQATFGNCNYQCEILKKDANHAFIMPTPHLPTWTGGCDHVHLISNIQDVLVQADAIYDFSLYDDNGDNIVEIHFTSIGSWGSGGVVGPCVTYTTGDIGIGGANVVLKVIKQTRGSNRERYLNVFYHESGHDLFEFPDMDHRGSYLNSHYGVGGYDVMCSIYGFNSVPSLYNPFFRHMKGWFTPASITSTITNVQLQDFQTNQTCYVYEPGNLSSDAMSNQRFYISYHYCDPLYPESNYYYSEWPYADDSKGAVLIWHSKGESCGNTGSYYDWRRMPLDIECAHGKTNWTETSTEVINTGVENAISGRDKLEIRKIDSYTTEIDGPSPCEKQPP